LTRNTFGLAILVHVPPYSLNASDDDLIAALFIKLNLDKDLYPYHKINRKEEGFHGQMYFNFYTEEAATNASETLNSKWIDLNGKKVYVTTVLQGKQDPNKNKSKQ
jgi:hypothetical protein